MTARARLTGRRPKLARVEQLSDVVDVPLDAVVGLVTHVERRGRLTPVRCRVERPIDKRHALVGEEIDVHRGWAESFRVHDCAPEALVEEEDTGDRDWLLHAHSLNGRAQPAVHDEGVHPLEEHTKICTRHLEKPPVCHHCGALCKQRTRHRVRLHGVGPRT